jgi:putative acetyltransferase
MSPTTSLRIDLEPPRQPDVIALIDELDAYQAALYPPESNHGIDLQALAQPEVLFAVARGPDGEAFGCGALVLGPDHGELKRMFVRPQRRGLGAGKALLAFLEAEARRRGCARFQLETGISQPEALGLYERSGYERCGPFGAYAADPLSVFMRKSP